MRPGLRFGVLAAALSWVIGTVHALPSPPLSPPGWTPGPDFPSDVIRGVGVYFPGNDRFYVMGGRTSDGAGNELVHPVEYNPYANSWTAKAATYPDNLTNNMACGVVTISTALRIVCIGGSAGGFTASTARVFLYDPIGDSITTLPAGDNWPAGGAGGLLPGGFAVVANSLYTIGGYDSVGTSVTNQTWRFDADSPSGSRWSARANFPVSRGYIPTTAIDGQIYTAGGADAMLTDTTNSYRYNPVTNAWTAIATIPRAVSHTHAVTIAGRMWVLGGGRQSPNPSNEVDIYDPVSNIWTLGPPFSTARRSFSADGNGRFSGAFLVGGYDSSGLTPLHTMESYNSALPAVTFTAAPLGSGSPGYPGSSGQQAGRLSRSGLASYCTATQPNPGMFDSSPRTYDAYSLKNTSAANECVEVTVSTACSGLHMIFPAVYLGSFNPANPAANWLADAGVSVTSSATFSFNLGSLATAVLVVNEIDGGFGCASYTVTVRGLTWHVPYDTNHDILTDRTIFRPSTGVWYTALSSGGATATGWGSPGDIDVMGDYDGDGKADIAVWRPSTGVWYIVQSSTGTVRTDSWGLNGDIPLAGDVDGDAKDDLVVYRPSAGAWFFKRSGGGTSVLGWGLSTDQPLLGDFDGDGKADPVAYRPTSGVWYIAVNGGIAIGWGISGDIALIGNWDGDAKADAAVFRPSSGQWLIQKSGGGTLAATWGVPGDVPVSGDVDGDGKSDFTVYRNGVWYSQLSSGGTVVVGWGTTGDKPVGRLPGS